MFIYMALYIEYIINILLKAVCALYSYQYHIIFYYPIYIIISKYNDIVE